MTTTALADLSSAPIILGRYPVWTLGGGWSHDRLDVDTREATPTPIHGRLSGDATVVVGLNDASRSRHRHRPATISRRARRLDAARSTQRARAARSSWRDQRQLADQRVRTTLPGRLEDPVLVDDDGPRWRCGRRRQRPALPYDPHGTNGLDRPIYELPVVPSANNPSGPIGSMSASGGRIAFAIDTTLTSNGSPFTGAVPAVYDSRTEVTTLVESDDSREQLWVGPIEMSDNGRRVIWTRRQ